MKMRIFKKICTQDVVFRIFIKHRNEYKHYIELKTVCRHGGKTVKTKHLSPLYTESSLETRIYNIGNDGYKEVLSKDVPLEVMNSIESKLTFMERNR